MSRIHLSFDRVIFIQYFRGVKHPMNFHQSEYCEFYYYYYEHYVHLERQAPEISRNQAYGPGGSRYVVGSDGSNRACEARSRAGACAPSRLDPLGSTLFFFSQPTSSIRV